MRKGLSVVLVIAICLGLMGSVSAAETTATYASDSECMAFLDSYGIEIPAEFETTQAGISFARTILSKLEANPNATFAYNTKALNEFAADIKSAYWEEHNYRPINTRTLIQDTSNILVYNEVVGTWDDSYPNYNCYAYAIGYDLWIHPGQLKWMSQGNEYGTYVYNTEANILTIADWVYEDLESIGYTVHGMTTSMPNTTITEHTRLICVRKDNDGVDFHLMKLETDGEWYHKPGGTNPLRYTSIQSSSYVWIREVYYKENGVGIYERDNDMTYDSLIYYISYSMPHEYEFCYCGTVSGTNYHIKTCTGCGETTGSKLFCTYMNNGTRCDVCGHPKSAVGTASVIPFEKLFN